LGATQYRDEIWIFNMQVSFMRWRWVLFSASVILAGCSEHSSGNYQGYVEGEFVYVASPFGGRLEHLNVHRGQTVVLHEPLFKLEAEEESAARRQIKGQLAAAKSQLEDLKTGKRQPELNVIQAQLDQSIAIEKKTALQLKRDQALVQSKAVSEAQLEESRAAESANQAKIRELKSQMDAAKLPARMAQFKAQTAQTVSALAALDQASWKLNQKNVSATQSGLIFDTLYREGEWVPAGNPVVRMLPPANIKVRFFVSETELGKLKIGQTVTILCDGCKADIPAVLTYISNEAEYTPPIIYSNETRSKLIYMLEAHPTIEQAPLLHPGQPVEVRL